METLHEEMMTTKAVEYLMAVIFFWCFVARKR